MPTDFGLKRAKSFQQLLSKKDSAEAEALGAFSKNKAKCLSRVGACLKLADAAEDNVSPM